MLLTKKWALGSIPLTIFTILLFSQAQTAYADTNCSGFISGTIDDDLIIPSGSTCEVIGPLTVNGEIIVNSGASFFGNVGGTIIGNIEATNCDLIFINQFSITGNIQTVGCNRVFVVNTATVQGNIILERTQIIAIVADSASAGNIQIIDGVGSSYQVWRSTTIGNIQIEGNTITDPSSPTPSFVGGNTIGGNLICFDNFPVPALGSLPLNSTPNGNGLGDCSGLVE